MLIDSHAHIQGKEYAGETEAVIARAREAGVETIIAVGGAGDMSSNTEAVALADSFRECICDRRHASPRRQRCRRGGIAELRESDLSARKWLRSARPGSIIITITRRTTCSAGFSRNSFTWRAKPSCRSSSMNGTRRKQAAELLRCEGAGKLRGVIHCFTGNYEAASRLS